MIILEKIWQAVGSMPSIPQTSRQMGASMMVTGQEMRKYSSTISPSWAMTKDTGIDKVDINRLHPLEQDKIHCGMKCFVVLKGFSYVIVNRVSQLAE